MTQSAPESVGRFVGRTFAPLKAAAAFALAFLGEGLAFASAPVAELFARVKYPYNINCLAQAAVAERLSFDIAGQVAQLRAGRNAVGLRLFW